MFTRMAVETTRFIRKPLYVEAVRITNANFDAIMAWCGGEVMQDDVPGRGRSKKYIKVEVHNPKNPRQTKAKVGDWLLKTDKGYKIYTDKAFHESFHTIEEDGRSTYVINQFGGDTPETVALEAQRNAGLMSTSEEIVPGVTVGEAIQLLRSHVDMQETVGPEVELVPATPESIAQAVKENEAAQAITDEEARAQLGLNPLPAEAANPHISNGRVEAKIADAVESVATETEPKVEVDGGVQINDSSSSPPPVHNGKRVLTMKEQGEMDPDEIRDLLKSGEVVLSQDVAA